MLRRTERVARAIYREALVSGTCVAQMGDRQVARLYTNMIAPTLQLAADTFAAWEALPQHERQLAVLRMRHALAKVAPRSVRK